MTFFLCVLIHIADIPGPWASELEAAVRERDDDVDNTNAVTRRV